MKNEGFNHPKVLLAARDLGVSLCAIRGVLVGVWHVAAVNYPAGDVGRCSNEELAVAIGWDGDPERLVEVLVKRRLLDAVSEEQGRLYVHDWHIHCQDYTRQTLRNRKQNFANGATPYKKSKEENGEEQPSTDNNREPQKTTALAESKSKPKSTQLRARTHEAGLAPIGTLPGQEHITALRLYNHHAEVFTPLFGACGAEALDPLLDVLEGCIREGISLTADLLRAAEDDTRGFQKRRFGRLSPKAYAEGLSKVLALRDAPASGPEDEPEHVRFFRRPDEQRRRGLRHSWVRALVEGVGDASDCEERLRALWSTVPEAEARSEFEADRRWVMARAAEGKALMASSPATTH
jgi:hypothetical protein